MATASLTQDFGSQHPVASIAFLINDVRRSRFIKAGPTAAGIELTFRLKENFTTASAGINTSLCGVPVFTRKSSFRTLLSKHVVFVRRQFATPICIVLVCHYHLLITLLSSIWGFCAAVQ
jgi:hypothetical protein